MADKKRSLSRIPSGAFSRGFSLARMSLGAGVRTAAHAVGTVLSSPEARAEKFKEMLLQNARALTNELGQLKGSVMKIGQSLSMVGEQIFPPEVNEVLKSLQSQAPPLAWSEIEKVLKRQLGAEKLALLEIEKEATASASLGQVHRAVIRATGEIVAVKVQYPGVDDAVDSDLRVLKRLMSIAKVMPGGDGVDEIFDEIRVMLHQELDFNRERAITDEFRELYATDPRLVVPRTYAEFSNQRVLVTSFEDGVPADAPEVAALSQERRNAFALAFMEAYFREVFVWGKVQTDPHLGNYRIRIGGTPEEDRLVLLDFGAVREFPKSFLAPYYELVKGGFEEDRQRLSKAGLEMGFLREGDGDALKDVFYRLCRAIMEPFSEPGHPDLPEGVMNSEGAYSWGAGQLPKRVAKVASEMIWEFKTRKPPREVVFLDRKMGGVYIFISVLKAKIRTRGLLKSYLDRIS